MTFVVFAVHAIVCHNQVLTRNVKRACFFLYLTVPIFLCCFTYSFNWGGGGGLGGGGISKSFCNNLDELFFKKRTE